MRIQVLGPVCAWRDGIRLDLGSPQRRAVLALLAVSRGQQLPFFGLADALWGERPPATASNVVQTHIKHLRHLLEPDRPPRARSAVLPRLGDGYALRVPYDAIDLLHFRDLVAGAVTVRRDGRGGGQERAAALLTEALGLWQQPPLADLPFLSAHPVVVALAEERRGAVAQYGEAMIAAGRSADALPVLEETAVAQPLDEDAQARLIRAYEAVGRRDQAVAVYRRSRRRLADELGVDPGPALAEAYAALLRRRARPSTPADGTGTGTGTGHAPVSGHGTAGAAELAAQVPAHVPPYPPSAHRLPAQLPADVPDFAGRDSELSALDRLLAAAADSPTAGAVSVVSGTAGVGKTALAVHWAHRTRHRFPDGQLYVNLRGYDPERPMPPGDALTRFLSVLGVPGDAIPLDVDDRASRFRTELADRRMLVVLDNALSEEQVRPLLPGSPACSVVVTSRDSLAGLVALHGARRIGLGPLPPPDAIALLRRLVGERVDTEPGPAAALAEQCARLPLALRVAAELAVAHPSSRLADLVAELADQQRRLDLLDAGGDRRAALEAVFSWSYERLPAPAARTFRLLSLHPGPEADAHAVAALTGEAPDEAPVHALGEAPIRAPGEAPVHGPGQAPTRVPGEEPTQAPGEGPPHAPGATRDERPGHVPGTRSGQVPGSVPRHTPEPLPGLTPARPSDAVPGDEPADAGEGPAHAAGTLALLARAHLLQPVRPGRFGTHDLLRAYAFRLTRTHDSEADRQAALVRLFDHYLSTAAAAMDTLYPAERHHRPAVAPSVHVSSVVGNAAAARAWLDAERPTLAAVCAVAADRGSPRHAVRLAALLFRHLDSGHHTEALEIHRHALRAAETIGDLGGQAHALTNLGVVHWRLADAGSAEDHLVRALELHHRTGDLAGRARTLSNLGNVHWRLGSLRDAAHDHQQALALYRETGDQVGQARTLTNLGNVCLRLGEYEQAADHQRQALALHDLTGDRIGRARTLSHLGNALLRLGSSEAAAECQEQALALFRQLGHHGGEAYALSGLGDIRLGQGEFEAAVTCQRRALELFRENGEGYGEASALNGLAEALHGSGRHDEALDHHSTAATVAAVTGEHDQLARAHAGVERARRALGPWVAATASSTTSGP
ncbi:AfsR/SARP family transcriptional regulator [Streptomyces liliifuscus]|uniref:Tetratricopeptide repeat protein n=1 Tax=Streptomyces liliifuscus TaxID=2797636 RepID=A0A7T7I1V2_9ACTN|nr:tetratricopeptide repeat protein [Streptomyces liliifuscus]QQM39428.1 tetratricopeptide repeat protein [Streptomyces liliifuscus]